MFQARFTLIATVAVAVAAAITPCFGNAQKTAQPSADKSGQTDGMPSHLIWIRMLPFELRDRGWQLSDENGQEVLDMIKELKPDVLDRFITGKPDQTVMVPMRPGEAPLKFVDYLDAAMKAGAPGCFLTPKDHLNDVWPEQYRMEAAQELFDLPVTPRLKAMDLDEFFTHGTPDEQKQVIQKFKDIGWKDLGYNFAGGSKPGFGLISYAMAGVSKITWEVNTKALDAMKDQGIRIRLAHIDYPGAIAEFRKLPPDRQADIIQKIVQEQHQYDFTFIYPVIYPRMGYDASKQVTSLDGPYKGATILQVIKQDIECDRQYPKKCAIPLPASDTGTTATAAK